MAVFTLQHWGLGELTHDPVVPEELRPDSDPVEAARHMKAAAQGAWPKRSTRPRQDFEAKTLPWFRAPLIDIEVELRLARHEVREVMRRLNGKRLAASALARDGLKVGADIEEERELIRGRVDYYRLVAQIAKEMGHHVIWPALAASIVEMISTLVDAHPMMINDEQLITAMLANRLILRYAYVRIERLLNMVEPLEGRDAAIWDLETIAEEQLLIDPLYAAFSPESAKSWAKIMMQKGVYRTAVIVMGKGFIPPFKKDPSEFEARWESAIELVESIHRTTFTKEETDKVLEGRDPDYANGEMFTTLSREIHGCFIKLGML